MASRSLAGAAASPSVARKKTSGLSERAASSRTPGIPVRSASARISRGGFFRINGIAIRAIRHPQTQNTPLPPIEEGGGRGGWGMPNAARLISPRAHALLFPRMIRKDPPLFLREGRNRARIALSNISPPGGEGSLRRPSRYPPPSKSREKSEYIYARNPLDPHPPLGDTRVDAERPPIPPGGMQGKSKPRNPVSCTPFFPARTPHFLGGDIVIRGTRGGKLGGDADWALWESASWVGDSLGERGEAIARLFSGHLLGAAEWRAAWPSRPPAGRIVRWVHLASGCSAMMRFGATSRRPDPPLPSGLISSNRRAA